MNLLIFVWCYEIVIRLVNIIPAVVYAQVDDCCRSHLSSVLNIL